MPISAIWSVVLLPSIMLCTVVNLPLTFLHYSYLVTVMGLVIPWSFTLAMVDGYSVLVKCPLRQPGILLIIVVGDWVTNKHRSDLGSSMHTYSIITTYVIDSTYFSTGTINSYSSCSMLNS